MPTYELALLLKPIPRQELAAALKRTATAIFEEGGILRKMENLGLKNTPFKMSAHGKPHRVAHYFVFKFDVGLDGKKTLEEKYGLDVDIIRSKIIFKNSVTLEKEAEEPCTLHLDLLPPPERPSVIEMVQLGKRRERKPFKYNSGLDYYPFQR